MANDFKIDLKESEIITSYLDKYFYDVLVGSNIIEHFERNNSDIDKQYRGIDVVIVRNNREFLIDEKAQAHYGRRPLPTFAFEVSYKNKNGKINCGWLIDDKKLSEFWLLIWPTINSNESSFREENIDRLDLMLIRCSDLLDYFEKYGWTKQRIEEFDGYYRQSVSPQHKGEPSQYTIECYNSSDEVLHDRRMFYWYYSSQLKEKPINIVVRKKELEKIAVSIFVVDKTGIRRING